MLARRRPVVVVCREDDDEDELDGPASPSCQQRAARVASICRLRWKTGSSLTMRSVAAPAVVRGGCANAERRLLSEQRS